MDGDNVLTPKLVSAVLEFRKARDWEQFHSARNIATALSVEASELLEHFVWTSDLQESQVVKERRSAIAEEIADLAILLTYLTHDLSIDLEAAVSAKMVVNAQKYPIEKARGSNRKYTDL